MRLKKLRLDNLLKIDDGLILVKNNEGNISTSNAKSNSIEENISGVAIDSRKCEEGFLFAAYEGVSIDGHDFIQDAINNGAKFILTDLDYNHHNLGSEGVIFIKHDNPRFVSSKIISEFYKEKPDYIAFVTGTNGKSSVACFVSQLWRLLGHKAASIGTLGVQRESINEFGDGLTTPDAVTLNRYLNDLKKDTYQRAIVESSSHGLSLDRLVGIKSDIAAFLNITRDHLDYHGSFSSYFDAKLKVFDHLKDDNSVALINSDIKELSDIKQYCNKLNIRNNNDKNTNILTFGFDGDYIKLISSELDSGGRNVEIELENTQYKFFFPFLNQFQVSNLLCAISIVMHSGENINDIIPVISELKNVPGRMELASINKNNGVPIYVDFAHTPDALDNILESCNEYVESSKGRIILVFGCGGDRDKGKRKIMGQIANDKADIVIVTDDNPRTENSADIRSEIMGDCHKAQNIGSRKDAIYRAIEQSDKGDIVIIAGKGHEKYQIVGDRKIDFNDIAVVKKSLLELEMIA